MKRRFLVLATVVLLLAGVGITAEAGKPTSPGAEPVAPEAKSLPTWVIMSPVVGVVLLGVFVLLLVKRRRHS